jgi:hypothetical protein
MRTIAGISIAVLFTWILMGATATLAMSHVNPPLKTIDDGQDCRDHQNCKNGLCDLDRPQAPPAIRLEDRGGSGYRLSCRNILCPWLGARWIIRLCFPF